LDEDDPDCEEGEYLAFINFESGNNGSWTNYNPGQGTPSWAVASDSSNGGTNAYRLGGTVAEVSGQARLGAYSILNNVEAADFELTATIRSSSTSSWRDLAIIFGYQNENNYYTAIFNNGCDSDADGIFKIVSGTKQKIGTGCSCTGTGCGTLSDQEYHIIKIAKNGSSIQAYVDDMQSPKFSATDSAYGNGSFGVGSINDTGFFDNIAISGAEECIDLTALTNYIGQWLQGQITMQALMQKIGSWKAGTGC
jgi:hypothetical protein